MSVINGQALVSSEWDEYKTPKKRGRPRGTMSKEKEAEAVKPQASAVEKGILSQLREKLASSGATGYKFRVTRRIPSAGYSYIGVLDGTIEDIESELLKRWGDGNYRLYAHWLDNRRVDNIPPLEFVVGDPESPKAKQAIIEEAVGTQAKSKRVLELENEAEVKRREIELKRLERQARKEEEQDEEPMNAKLEALEEKLEEERARLQHERNTIMQKQREERAAEQIKRLEAKIESTHRAPSQNSEVEALRKELENMRRKAEEDARRNEMLVLQKGFENQILALKNEMALSRATAVPQTNIKDIAAIITPLVPIMTALVTRPSNKTDPLDMIVKIAPLAKELMGGGMNLKELIPLISKMGGGQEAVINMISNMITPMIETVASQMGGGGGGGDVEGIGGTITKVLGLIGKGLSDSKELMSKQLDTEKTRAETIQRLSAQGAIPGHQQQQMARRKHQQMRAAKMQQQQAMRREEKVEPHRPEVKPTEAKSEKARAGSLMGIAQKVQMAIENEEENFHHISATIRKELHPSEIESLKKYSDPMMIAVYLGSLPGIKSSVFSTQYAHQWLTKFVKHFTSPPVPPRSSPLAAPLSPRKDNAPKPFGIGVPVVLGGSVDIAPSKPSKVILGTESSEGFGKDASPSDLIAKNSVELTTETPANILPNHYKYPKDSVVQVVEVDGFTMPVEYPTEETLKEREKENNEILSKVNPKSAKILTIGNGG